MQNLRKIHREMVGLFMFEEGQKALKKQTKTKTIGYAVVD